MGPSPTPPPLSFGYRCCSCGSGPISHGNPGIMISPSTVITPVPGAPSLSQRARHTFSSSQPSGHKAHTGKGVALTSVTLTSLSLHPYPVLGLAGTGLALHRTNKWNQHLWGQGELSISPGTGSPLGDLPACLQLQEGQD